MLSFPSSLKGQERYGNMTRVYYREAVGALVVFDMTRLSTFQAVLKWKGDLDAKVDELRGGKSRERGKKLKDWSRTDCAGGIVGMFSMKCQHNLALLTVEVTSAYFVLFSRETFCAGVIKNAGEDVY